MAGEPCGLCMWARCRAAGLERAAGGARHGPQCRGSLPGCINAKRPFAELEARAEAPQGSDHAAGARPCKPAPHLPSHSRGSASRLCSARYEAFQMTASAPASRHSSSRQSRQTAAQRPREAPSSAANTVPRHTSLLNTSSAALRDPSSMLDSAAESWRVAGSSMLVGVGAGGRAMLVRRRVCVEVSD